MSTLSFNNVSLLSYSHKPKFLGDDIFNYAIEKKIKIEGYLLDLQNFEGVSGVISGINDIKKLIKNSGEFILNNNYFGTGYITNIEIKGDDDSPNWVRYANYVADILVLSTGSIHDMTGSYYELDPLNFNVKNLYLLDEFNEDFSMNLDKDGIYKYSHNCRFEFENGIAKNIALSIAKGLASGIISKEIPLKITEQYDGLNFLSGKKIYKEEYDIINNIYSFEETFEKSKSGDFADVFFQYSIDTEENGLVNVKENAQIKSLSSPVFQKSIDKLSLLREGSYSRCENIYNYYYNNSGTLNENSVSQGFSIDRFKGEIDFESNFSNSEFINSGYEWEFSSEAEDTPEKITVTTTIKVNGHGPNNSEAKWNNAIYGFNAKKHLLTDSSSKHNAYHGLYLAGAAGKCRPNDYPNNLYEDNAETSFYNGEIKVSKKYSDIYNDNITSTSITSSVPLFSFYRSANYIFRQRQLSIGKKTITNTSFYNDSIGNIYNETVIPPVNGLVESQYVRYNLSKNTRETSVTTYEHE